jgi:hypothetical protein
MEVESLRWSPKLSTDIRQLISAISLANPLWGAPRIHGELLKLGIDVGQASVAKYMARNKRPPSWRAGLGATGVREQGGWPARATE